VLSFIRAAWETRNPLSKLDRRKSVMVKVFVIISQGIARRTTDRTDDRKLRVSQKTELFYTAGREVPGRRERLGHQLEKRVLEVTSSEGRVGQSDGLAAQSQTLSCLPTQKAKMGGKKGEKGAQMKPWATTDQEDTPKLQCCACER